MADDAKGLDDDVAAGSGPVTLVSKEGTRYPISRRAAEFSQLIRTAIENDTSAAEIQLAYIEGETVAKVVEWCEHHVKEAPRPIEKPLPTSDMKELLSDFDYAFSSTDQDTMFKLLLAANYLDINPLLMLMCARCASLIKGKTPEEIRQTFNIRSDYSPEEEEEVRREYRDLLE